MITISRWQKSDDHEIYSCTYIRSKHIFAMVSFAPELNPSWVWKIWGLNPTDRFSRLAVSLEEAKSCVEKHANQLGYKIISKNLVAFQ